MRGNAKKHNLTDAKVAIPASHSAPLEISSLHHAALWIALAVVIFLAFILNLHAIPLLDVDEGAFSEATREMLVSGDYITTYMNGSLRFDKPILIYWLQAFSASLFGIDEFAFRLPSVLAAVGWIGAILVFTRQQSDQTTGLIAALMTASTLGIVIIGRAAIADALLNLFLVLALFDIYRYLEQPQPKLIWRTYLWIGLGLLTKGPIAVLIPFAAGSITFLLHGKFRTWLKAMFNPVGWIILLAVAAPWYVLEYLQQGQAFIDGFFLRHNIDRFRNPMQGHSGGFLYYLPALLFLLLPYTGLFIRILPTLRLMRRSPLSTFLWSWFLFVLVFFSLSSTKLPHYLIYGLTPLFILMSIYRDRLASLWLAFAPPIAFLCLVLALPSLVSILSVRLENIYFQEMLSRQDMFGTVYYVSGSLLLIAALLLAMHRRLSIFTRLAGMGILCTYALAGLALPAIVDLQQGPVKEAALIARQSGIPVTRWQIHMPSFSVYLGNVTKAYVPTAENVIIFTRVDKMGGLGPVEVLYRKGGIVLVKKTR